MSRCWPSTIRNGVPWGAPQLSVIRQPATETGKTAWELMMRRVAGNTGRPRKVVLEAEIVLRDLVRELKTTRARRPAGLRLLLSSHPGAVDLFCPPQLNCFNFFYTELEKPKQDTAKRKPGADDALGAISNGTTQYGIVEGERSRAQETPSFAHGADRAACRCEPEIPFEPAVPRGRPELHRTCLQLSRRPCGGRKQGSHQARCRLSRP